MEQLSSALRIYEASKREKEFRVSRGHLYYFAGEYYYKRDAEDTKNALKKAGYSVLMRKGPRQADRYQLHARKVKATPEEKANPLYGGNRVVEVTLESARPPIWTVTLMHTAKNGEYRRDYSKSAGEYTRHHDGPSISPAVAEAKRLAKKCGKGTYVVIYGATSAETLQWDGARFVNRGLIK
jgi:hypothetical protein